MTQQPAIRTRKPRRGIPRSLAVLIALALGSATVPAFAASNDIGETGTGGTNCIGPGTWTTPENTVPADVSQLVAFNYDSTAANAGQRLDFVVLRPTGSGNDHTVIGKSGLRTLAGTGRESFPVDIAVQPGDLIGFWIEDQLAGCARTESGKTVANTIASPNPTVGSTIEIVPSYPGYTLNLSATPAPTPLTVRATQTFNDYGGAFALRQPTFEGLRPGDTNADLDVPVTCTTTAVSGSPAGVYPITCTGSDPSYDITFIDSTLTINPGNLFITAEGNGTYGSVPVVTPSIFGFVNGDDVSDLGPNFVCTTTATATSPVGRYPATCSGATNPSYVIYGADRSFEVTPAPLEITASSGTSVYGTDPGPVTPSYDGFVNGEDPGVLDGDLTCSTTATATSPAGTYPTTCTGATAANYAISYTAGTWEVTPAPLSINASSGSSPYGTDPGPVTPSYDGFVNGDDGGDLGGDLTCSTTATATSDVGTYPTTCTGATADNYAITYNAGTWDVTKANVGLVTSSTSGLVSLLTLRTTYTTVATNTDSGGSAAGIAVVITLNNRPQCTAITDAQGIATCTGPLAITLGIPGHPYTASTSGNQNYNPATANGMVPLF